MYFLKLTKAKVLIILIFLTLASLASYRLFLFYNDYSNIKGDFKLFKFGDSKKIAISKLKYMEKHKRLLYYNISTFPNRYFLKTDLLGRDSNCALYFNNNKLYKIFIEIWYGKNGDLKELMYFSSHPYERYIYGTKFIKELYISLVPRYGQPNKHYIINFNQAANKTVYAWDLKSKTISVGYDEELHPVIYIKNIKLTKEAEISKDFY